MAWVLVCLFFVRFDVLLGGLMWLVCSWFVTVVCGWVCWVWVVVVGVVLCVVGGGCDRFGGFLLTLVDCVLFINSAGRLVLGVVGLMWWLGWVAILT